MGRSMSDVLQVRDLKVEFNLPEGPLKAVDGVSFRIPEHKTVALVGESGSGKSVIAQSIMGLLPRVARITGGEILFADSERGGDIVDIAKLDVDSRAMRRLRGGRISIIFQEPMTSLSPLHTIGDQIGEALHLHSRKSCEEGREITAAMLRVVGFPEPVRALKTYPFELSGGLRQRAMIAMALVCRPAILIADEPTTALDVTIQAQILKLMQDLQAELGMAILIITHDLGVVANLAEEIIVVYHGKVMERGTRDHIFRDAQHPYLNALLHAVPRFHMDPGERLVPIREIKPEGGRLLAAKEPWPAGADASAPLLRVKNLRKAYTIRKRGLFGGSDGASYLAVDNVSFDIQRGECLGLVGESGCGKTTMSKILLRALSADAGEVVYNDRGRACDVLAINGKDLTMYRRRVQYIFQDPFGSLNPRMTVFDIISEPLVIHQIGDQAERGERVRELMTLVGLDIKHLRRYPHSFSGGQRQRIGIARALALQPDLLICDEPVSALDVSIQAQVLNLLKDLQAKLGLTYLFISHNLAVVDYVADRIAVMCAGKLVELAPREVFFKKPVHPYSKALLAAVPEPNPDNPLDFDALMAGRASDPTAWPEPFTADGAREPRFVNVGDGHFVRANDETALEEIMA